MLFENRIALNKQYNYFQDLKATMREQIMSLLISLHNEFLQRDQKWMELKHHFKRKAYEKELEQNFNIWEETKIIYDIYNNLKENGMDDRKKLHIKLTEITTLFNTVANRYNLQSVIIYSNTSRNKSLNYLSDNLSKFRENMKTIYDLVRGHVDLNYPQDGSDKSLQQTVYFSKKIQYIKDEIRDHILIIKALRTDVSMIPPKNKDLKDLQLTDLPDDNDIIYKCILFSEAEIEATSNELWNPKLYKDLTTTLDYDVKVLRNKLFSLFRVKFKADFANRLNNIKSGLVADADKTDYLTKTINDIKLRKKAENDKINNIPDSKHLEFNLNYIKYEVELFNDLLKTLRQLETLYKTIIKLTPNDILLSNISNFNVGRVKEGIHGAIIYLSNKELVKLFYESNDIIKVRPTIREFHLMFFKYRLTFFSNSVDINPLQNDVTDEHAKVNFSNFNLLTLSEIEKDIEVAKQTLS
jgi:hypothetical protein